MLGCKPINSLIEIDHSMKNGDGYPINMEDTRDLSAKLIYISYTHIDLPNAISKQMHDPYTSHLEAVYCILRYLKSSPSKGICFLIITIEFGAYMDAD